MAHKETRRDFLKLAGSLSAGLLLGTAGCSANAKPNAKAPKAIGTTAAGLTAKPLDTVRIAMIGVGSRGSQHINQLVRFKHVQIVAIAEPHAPAANKARPRALPPS